MLRLVWRFCFLWKLVSFLLWICSRHRGRKPSKYIMQIVLVMIWPMRFSRKRRRYRRRLTHNKLCTFKQADICSSSWIELRSCFKTQFPLRTAAISPRCAVGTKVVLDVASATPVAILNLRLARGNFARSRDESSFETSSRFTSHWVLQKALFPVKYISNSYDKHFSTLNIFKLWC